MHFLSLQSLSGGKGSLSAYKDQYHTAFFVPDSITDD